MSDAPLNGSFRAKATNAKAADIAKPPVGHNSALETKSMPKKIDRFSHLPHVKDKVEAFEKISG